jgi:ribose-phosphate pyrophosphokinase
MPTICEAIREMNLNDLIIVSPDAGFAKNARKYADMLRCSVAIGDKTRFAHDEKAQILDIIGDVAGKTAVIVDDFAISCGTLAEIARVLQRHGAKRILACVTHALLGSKGVNLLEGSPIEQLLVTDTLENEHVRSCSKAKIISVAPLFAQAINIIQRRESLSLLFE